MKISLKKARSPGTTEGGRSDQALAWQNTDIGSVSRRPTEPTRGLYAEELIQKFKKVLGTGGSLAENGAMSFQGDNAALLVDMLVAMGYKAAKQTGGLGGKK
jgi:hypothetical protein